MSSLRGRLRALAAALLFGLAFPVAVAAVAVPELDGQVTDLAGVIDDEGALEEQLEERASQSGVQLWAVFVDETGLDGAGFAEDVAAENGLGVNDAVLAVGVDDRKDGIWVADGLDEIKNE